MEHPELTGLLGLADAHGTLPLFDQSAEFVSPALCRAIEIISTLPLVSPFGRGRACEYLVKRRMIGGFAILAWPVRYGDTGVMTFMVNQEGVVYERYHGPETAAKAAAITVYNPDKNRDKATMTPP
ncbi:MAG: DUF2950 family protein [Reyranella sp.]|uniref:DUF2950 family protein n=1 Tax=Reyranella sp. TaxID=1929291 RepID=UPI00120DBA5D|nr:DUF2950 family protein [Reyranella sp.]TAJ90757.1 MAG: DUF2950 family protein [Reyranella sp.]TBR27287.1 MAG: DUF2950 family protein [Reyranella sp.]